MNYLKQSDVVEIKIAMCFSWEGASISLGVEIRIGTVKGWGRK
jgi:hypothetical protein